MSDVEKRAQRQLDVPLRRRHVFQTCGPSDFRRAHQCRLPVGTEGGRDLVLRVQHRSRLAEIVEKNTRRRRWRSGYGREGATRSNGGHSVPLRDDQLARRGSELRSQPDASHDSTWRRREDRAGREAAREGTREVAARARSKKQEVRSQKAYMTGR